jgi:transposase
MVQKLKLQLARRNRTLFGTSSERFEDGQGSLIEPVLLDEIAAAKTPAKPVSPAANTEIDRSLPAHLPRDEQVHRPETTAAHHDNDGHAASARTSPSNSNTCPRTSRSSATCGPSWPA